MTDGHDGGASEGFDVAHLALRELVLAATVRIHRRGAGYAHDEPGGFLGSGFFVAPNWVLTCAHVVQEGEGGEVAVVYRTSPYEEPRAVPARVAATLPEHAGGRVAGGWPAPDLALVRLREPAEHACVYVSERPAVHVGGRTVFYAGWTAARGRLEILDGSLSVQGTISAWSSEEQVRLGRNDLPPGVSGGPVVDPVRGEVVGVLKSRADHGTGGTCIGVQQLRTLQAPQAARGDPYQVVFHAHDRYHRDRQQPSGSPSPTWADVQGELGVRPGRTLSPHERSELLGRLADLPPPLSTRGLLDILSSLPDFRLLSATPAPRGWRDGLGALYEHARQDGALKLVLDYAMRILAVDRPRKPGTIAAEQALWDWVKQAATGLDSGYRRGLAERRAQLLGPRTTARDAHQRGGHTVLPELQERVAAHSLVAPPGPSVLLVVLRRGWEPDRCDWSVSVAEPDGATTRLHEAERTHLDDLPAHVAAPLTEAFRRSDEPGRPATLHAALPHLRLDLAVDEWRLWPGGAPLGVERPVLIRCSDRDQLPDDEEPTFPGTRHPAAWDPYGDEDGERRDGWRRLHARQAQSEVLDCDDGVRKPVPGVAALRGLTPHSVPVLCRLGDLRYDNDPASLGRILRSGFGVALWRHRGTPKPESVCGEFHRGVKTVVDDGDGVAFLPDVVHGLRLDVSTGRTEAFWADGIALLYDDPHRPLPGTDDLLEAP